MCPARNFLNSWWNEQHPLICGSVAQHRLFARVAGVRYHDRTTFRANGWTLFFNGLSFFFMVFMFFKEYNPEVPSHNSFESQLYGTLKNPHAIRKEKARSSRCCGFVLHPKNVKVFFFFKQKTAYEM